METNADLVDREARQLTRGVVGDAADRDVLREAGAATADAVIVCTGEYLAVLATLALTDLGVPEIRCETLGMGGTIFPEREGANRVAHRIASKAVYDSLPLTRGNSSQQVAIPDGRLGRSQRDLEPRRYGINVVAPFDVLSETLTPVPDPDRPLEESDMAQVVGRDDASPVVPQWWRPA